MPTKVVLQFILVAFKVVCDEIPAVLIKKGNLALNYWFAFATVPVVEIIYCAIPKKRNIF